jgi:glycosyltransferase involved in cell wall biosynthesis
MPEVSVIFLSYNQASYVAEALVSVLDQASHDFEVIVADDGSTDGTAEVIDEVLSHHPRSHLALRLEKKPNLGFIRNWNRAVRSASGAILVAQAGDDISRPDRLSVLLRQFGAKAECMAVSSQVDVIDGNGKLAIKGFERGRTKPASYSFDGITDGFDFWKGAPALGACAAYRASVAKLFPPIEWALSEDQPYVYRALLLGHICYTPEALLQWRWHGSNLSLGSLSDESDPVKALTKRAAMSFARHQAASQYEADAHHALKQAYISSVRYDQEVSRIASYKCIELLAGYSISPNHGWRLWVAAAMEVMRRNELSARSVGYVLRSALKKMMPVSFKLRYSRILR